MTAFLDDAAGGAPASPSLLVVAVSPRLPLPVVGGGVGALPLRRSPGGAGLIYSGWHPSDQLRTGTDSGNPTV